MDFNYKKCAKWLKASGIIGIVLSCLFMYFQLISRIQAYTYGADPLNLVIIQFTLQSGYYFLNSILLLLAGIYLKKADRTGLTLFFIAIALIALSLIIPEDFLKYLDSSFGNLTVTTDAPLFFATIGDALFGGLVSFGFSFIGTIIFFYGIILNLCAIKRWNKLLNSPNQF